jgi:hypothetical protein
MIYEQFITSWIYKIWMQDDKTEKGDLVAMAFLAAEMGVKI